jgi:hypothetical protein
MFSSPVFFITSLLSFGLILAALIMQVLEFKAF